MCGFPFACRRSICLTGIDIFCLPANTTHELQPLDVGVFGPFKQTFRAALSRWSLSDEREDVIERHRLTHSEFLRILFRAWGDTMTPTVLKVRVALQFTVPTLFSHIVSSSAFAGGLREVGLRGARLSEG